MFKIARSLSSLTVIIFIFSACEPLSNAAATEQAQATQSVPRSTATSSLAKVTNTPISATALPTATPDELTDLGIAEPNGTIKKTFAHVGDDPTKEILRESIQRHATHNEAIGELITGKDAHGIRYLWNKKIAAWVPEIRFSPAYADAPTVELSAVYDGSLKLNALLYYAENQGIVPETAAQVHYMFNMGGGNVSIGPMRLNQQQWPQDPKEVTLITDATIEQTRTWGWLGHVKTFDNQGNEIILLSQAWLNPIETNSKNILPVFFGVSREEYEKRMNAIGNDGLNSWERMMQQNNLQLVLAYPYPPSFLEEEQAARFRYAQNAPMPTIGKLLQGRDLFSMFSPEVRAQLEVTYAAWETAPNQFSNPEHPFSFPVGVLPDEISEMVSFPGIGDFINCGC